MMKRILVIAAHPDDEVLGCGGTIAKIASDGGMVHVLFLADGVFSRHAEFCPSNELAARRDAANAACAILGVSEVLFGNFPDNRMDTVALLDVVKAIETEITSFCPDTVFTHHAGDLNIDHRLVHKAVVTACRPQTELSVKTLLMFEVPSSTEWQLPHSAPVFCPNWFVDVSSTFELKMAALNKYAAEMRHWPHPRSMQGIEHLNRWRGATVGVEVAEAFMLGRQML